MPMPQKYNGTVEEYAVLDVNWWIKDLKKRVWRELNKELGRRPTRKEVSEKLPFWLEKIFIKTTDMHREEKVHRYLKYASLPCRLGGVRHYFICPFCHNIKVKLYYCGDFACRICANLTYTRDRERHGRFEYLSKSGFLLKKIEKEKGNLRYPYWRGRLTKKAISLLQKIQKYKTYWRLFNSQEDSGIDNRMVNKNE